MKDNSVYRSKVGIMYFLVAVIIAVILVGSFLYISGDGNTVAIFIAYIIAAILYYFVLIHPVLNTKYILQADRLLIHCGIYKNEIAFQEILEVYKKKSFRRYPALSEQMVFIKYKNCGVTDLVGISPKNRDEFMQELQKKIQN